MEKGPVVQANIPSEQQGYSSAFDVYWLDILEDIWFPLSRCCLCLLPRPPLFFFFSVLSLPTLVTGPTVEAHACLLLINSYVAIHQFVKGIGN